MTLIPAKIAPKIFKIQVSDGRQSAILFAIAYSLDRNQRYVGFEVFQVVTSFDDSALSIPSQVQATFQQELRVLSQAAETYEGPRSEDRVKLEALMHDAYGPAAEVRVEVWTKSPG